MRKQRQSRTAGDNQLHYRHDLTIIKRSTAACADRKSISPTDGQHPGLNGIPWTTEHLWTTLG
jgi:hypothetical protein